MTIVDYNLEEGAVNKGKLNSGCCHLLVINRIKLTTS